MIKQSVEKKEVAFNAQQKGILSKLWTARLEAEQRLANVVAVLEMAKQLGLDERWAEIKRKYAQANLLLGDIPKVTPSSKVVGDLAQFMVSSNLEPEDIMASADSLPLPASVVSYFQGAIGVPPGAHGTGRAARCCCACEKRSKRSRRPISCGSRSMPPA